MTLFEKLKNENLVNQNGKVSPWCNRKISSSLREEVYRLSSFLQHDYNISDRIKILMLGYTDHPRCPCGSFVYYHRTKKDFVEYCSASCASKYTNEKRLETIKNRYNTDNFFPTITKEQRSINSKKANQKAREQLKNKYNVSNPMYIPGIEHKHKQSITGKTKTYTTGNHYSQKHFSDDMLSAVSDIEKLHKKHIDEKIPTTVLSQMYGFSQSFLHKKFTENGLQIKHFSESYPQKFFASLFEKFDYVVNDRSAIKPKEIDIYFPNQKIGVEIDGLFWHTTTKKNDDAHYQKWKRAKESGIRLIRFTDDEVFNKTDICHSIVLSALNNSPNRVYARKCQIKSIDNATYKAFCEHNHIHGYAHSKYRLGLYHEDNLVYVMGLSRARFGDSGDFEVVRSCSKIFHSVVGGFSKLIKYFVKNYVKSENIISFVDMRFFDGSSYQKLGFEYIDHTKPNYWYVDSEKYKLETRMKYQKGKLKNTLEYFDESLSEKENMILNGYRIYFDCGNAKYKLR